MKNLILLFVLLPALAFGHGSDTGHSHGKGHNKDPNTPPDNGGSPVVQTVGVYNDNDNSSASSSVAGASITTNGPLASVENVGGTGGTATGKAAASIGDINIQGDNFDVASSAASIIAGACQSGVSGQAKGWGFSAVGGDEVCDAYNNAQIEYAQHLVQLGRAKCETQPCTVQCNNEAVAYVTAEVETCPSDSTRTHALERAALHYERYEALMDKAYKLQEKYGWLDEANHTAKKAVTPGVLLWVISKALGNPF